MRITDELSRQLADVDHPAVVEPDVDERPEVDDVEDGTVELHPQLEILELENPLLEERLGEILAGIAARTSELIDDVGEQQAADAELFGEARQIEGRGLFSQCPGPLPVGEILRRSSEPLENLRGDLVALRMDPRGVEGVAAAGDLEEPGCLDVGRLTESRHLEELRPAGEGAVLRPPFLKALGHRLVEPRDVAKERGAGGVGVDADVVHAALHDRVERGIEVPGLDVVLIETDADVRRLDLHKLRERILEATAD